VCIKKAFKSQKKKKNKGIRIDKRPVFYKNYFEAGVICIQDLLFDLNIKEAFSHWSDKITNIRYLQWAGLRHSIPPLSKISFSVFF